MSEKKDKVSVLKGTGIGPTVSLEEGRKRLDDYMRNQPDEQIDICREVREMLGDTPEEAECGCREQQQKPV